MSPTTDSHSSYILDYKSWVAWPYCPVKRLDGDLAEKNLGVILADSAHAETARKGGAGPVRVYHAYMFLLPKEWDAVPRTDYHSVEALLADGWVVD